MNMELVKQYAEVTQALKDNGVIGFYQNGLHVRLSMIENEKELSFKKRECNDYPYEAFVQREGISLFALVNSSELGRFPQIKEEMKEQLRKQLEYLEEDVDLSGKEGVSIA